MFASIKSRFISVIAPDMPQLPLPPDHTQQSRGSYHQSSTSLQQQKQDKFVYARPPFLQLLTPDELRASADHNVRPIIVPRDISMLPWGTGYAECVNSGKSEWNEDQAAFCRQVLSDPTHRHPDVPYTYFGIFDGHAGYGAALAASHQFHHILHEKLVDCIDMLLKRDDDQATNDAGKLTTKGFLHPSNFYRRVSKDELITGAMESAFFHMDALIAQDRDRYRDAGGCTACVTLFICGKMYVANAGDSRAVLCQRQSPAAATDADIEKQTEAQEKKSQVDAEIEEDRLGAYPVPFSVDHTPETERSRLLNVARLKPELMGKHYAAMEYAKRPHATDLGQRILCRQGTMKGWTYKTLTREDLRMPVVTGEGKRSRLLGTLGVTRGFGDHDLLAIYTGTQIKPFLTPHPDVNYRDLSKIVSIPGENNEDGDYGILIMATDGLWDVSENEAVARTVFETLAKYPTEKHRYTMVAQELVARARGKINDSGHWRLAASKAAATVDDISVIVIPVYQYYKEHVEWEKQCAHELRERLTKEAQTAIEAKEDEDKQTLLVNGMTRASNVDEDEEPALELNKHKVQAQIVVEQSDELACKLSVPTDDAPKEFVANEKENSNANANANATQAHETDVADFTSELMQDIELNVAAAMLETTDISSDETAAETKSFHETANKEQQKPNKQQHQHQQQHHYHHQQRNRNRKDKH